MLHGEQGEHSLGSKGLGNLALWGHSRATNLLERVSPPPAAGAAPPPPPSSSATGTEEPSSMVGGSISTSPPRANASSCLLVGSGDARNVIKTAALAWRCGGSAPTFYLIEPQATLVARGILLLSVFLEPFHPSIAAADGNGGTGSAGEGGTSLGRMSWEERADLFLEVYGNLSIREKTAEWIGKRATDLLRILAGDGVAGAGAEGLVALNACLDFSALKFRERDDIETVFKYWRDGKKAFDGPLLWDHRLRAYYGVRYDHRENIIDWDYHMKLQPKASIIHKSELVRWRMTGISHGIRESVFNRTNRTLATVDLLRDPSAGGVRVAKWGYFSDIVLGPFLPFGTDTEYEWMLRQANGKHTFTSEALAKANLCSWLHEYHTSSAYSHPAAPISTKAAGPSDADAAKAEPEAPRITEIAEEGEEEGTKKELEGSQPEQANRQTEPPASKQTPAPTPFRVHYLPCDASITFHKHQAKYVHRFHRIFLTNTMAHRILDCLPLLTPRHGPTDPDPPAVLVETARFLLDWRPEQIEAFAKKVLELGASVGLRPVSSALDQEVITFIPSS